MATVRYPIQALLGVGITAALSVYGSFSFYDQQTARNKMQENAFQVGLEEQRFAALKHDLPADGMVGYVSDLSDNGILLAAQYALVPVLIVNRPPSGLVVGSFSRPMDYAEFGRARGLVLVKDYGEGITLYRKGP
ncbi:MAG: hypothetical protein LAP39_19485 [Acidobacteriia bacterium]|nr:hypothetical protein [Terriglobia bacterium]